MDTFYIYRNLPVYLQNICCSLQGYKIKKLRYNTEFRKYSEFLEMTDTWDQEKIRCYKEEQLARILAYSYEYCPFYRNSFQRMGVKPSDFKSLEDLKLFPILTKEDIRRNWQSMISTEYKKNQLVPYHTSGSTGTALSFYWTRESVQRYWSIVWRNRKRFGLDLKDFHLNLTGKLVCPLEQHKPPYWRYNRPMHQYLLNMQHIRPDTIEGIVRFINKFAFKYFIGYPSIINSLSSFINENGWTIEQPPTYIFTGAEKLYENQRTQIEQAFKGVQLIEHYGFSENAAAASQCKCLHYHEDFEFGHLELGNAQSHEKGIAGDLIATGFANYGMPFIRYRVGDYAIFNQRKCECGLQSQVIEDIEGRNESYVITPEGSKILRFDYLFKDTYSIKEVQVVQKREGEIILRIVRRENYDLRIEKSIKERVREWISPTIKVSFEYVQEIERTRAGKFRAVISELNHH